MSDAIEKPWALMRHHAGWADVFRIENGLIAEHWDPSELWVDGKPPGAEFFQ